MSPIDEYSNPRPDCHVNNDGVPCNGTLPGLAATMEIAGIESIPGANVGPTTVGYTRED